MARRDDVKGYVHVDSSGRMVVTGAALRRELGQRAGHYTHLPSDSALLHFQKTSKVPPHEEFRHPIAMSGDLARMESVEVINFVQSAQMSGNLIFIVDETRKSLFFKDGSVKSASSNRPEDRLGEVLYRYGAVSREQLTSALEECRRIRRPLGNYLLDQGLITQTDLYLNVRRQVEEIFYSILVMKTGEFILLRFEPEAVPGPLSLSTQSMLMEGLRRIDEMAHFRERIPENDVRLVAKAGQGDVQNLGPRERVILNVLRQPRTVAQVISACRFGEFETIKALYQLQQDEFLEEVEPADGEPVAPPEQSLQLDSETAAMIDTFNAVFERIFEAISRHGQENALEKGLETFLQFYGFVELFQDVKFENGRLDKPQLLKNLEGNDAENRLSFLSQALNELLFFEMFAAREWLERDEQQDLQKIINQLFIEIG